MSKDKDGYISFGVGLIFGLGLGAALGLLLTPKSGEDMRTGIKDMAHKIPDNVNMGIDETKDKCSNLIDMTKYMFEKQFNQIQGALKAGKMAAAKKREEFEEEIGY